MGGKNLALTIIYRKSFCVGITITAYGITMIV